MRGRIFRERRLCSDEDWKMIAMTQAKVNRPRKFWGQKRGRSGEINNCEGLIGRV